jgi:hypothetical protein
MKFDRQQLIDNIKYSCLVALSCIIAFVFFFIMQCFNINITTIEINLLNTIKYTLLCFIVSFLILLVGCFKDNK